MPYPIGIDLGTTNSVVSVYRRGVAETINIESRSTLSSVVSFRENGSVLVGQTAKARMLLDPENTVSSSKRFMGDRTKTYRIGKKSLTPVNIAQIVLKKIVEGASSTLGEKVFDAVITVPAYFTEAQREDTKRAGEEAGLNVLRLIPEPTAAAIAYGLDKGKDQTVMVYDLGGGTFDVSILIVKGNRFEVKAVGGNGRLGGDDFDKAIIDWAAGKFKAQSGIDIMGNKTIEGKKARQLLKEAAEVAKIELSQSDRAVISIPDCMGRTLDLELTLPEYNSLIQPFLKKTADLMKSVMCDARLRTDDIDRVILVGGSTKNRAVRELVTREIKEPYVADRVDEVVSHGAAVMAANLFLPEEDTVPIEVSDVTGHSLGIGMFDSNIGKNEFVPIIPRQTQYPCKRGILGTTHRPMQSAVLMTVYRGEDKDLNHDTRIGELELLIVPPQNEEVFVGAIFELDEDGIIKFTAVQFPSDHRILRPIMEYSREHNGNIDIGAVENLIRKDAVKTKEVIIKT